MALGGLTDFFARAGGVFGVWILDNADGGKGVRREGGRGGAGGGGVEGRGGEE